MDIRSILISVIYWAGQILFYLVIAEVILSYFMSPFHPVRQFINRIVGPLLTPIRRVLPTFGGLDFSPFLLMIIVQLVQNILIRLIRSL
ncbi:MAG TPA: YggT family protein [Anaerolineaceae bacterium]